MLTEQQNPNTLNIDQLTTLEMIQVMNAEDAKVARAVGQVLPNIAEAVEAIYAQFKRGGRLIYIGAGTSGRLGVLDAVECVPTFSAPPEMVVGIVAGGSAALTQSIEGAEDKPELGQADLEAIDLQAIDAVVGIAASGRTPYVTGALEYANQLGATTIGIACNVPSKVLETAQIAIGVSPGPEVITGSTRLKSGTAQKLVLNMLSTASMVRLGKVYGNLMVDVQVRNEKLADRARRIVSQIAEISHEEAGNFLAQANNEVKTAVVMCRRKVSAEEARQLLTEADGYLRTVIETE